MEIARTTVGAISKGVSFVTRQKRDWKVTVARASLDRFFYHLTLPYQSIYIVGLGASAMQLGIVNSAGLVVGGLLNPVAGWLIDRAGVKRIYLVGIGLCAIAYLIYGVAQSWVIIIIAMMVYWLGFNVVWPGCAVICSNSLINEDRATGMNLCETLAAGVMGMLAPMLGAFLVTTFGGVNVSGIRPLFFVSLAGTVAAFLLILTQLSNRRWGKLVETKPSFFKDISQVFKQGHNLKRWIAIISLTWLPWYAIVPFMTLFAREVKGADQYVLGAMVTGMALTSLAFGVLIGRLADRIGRKKVLFFLAPLLYVSSLLLIWAPSHSFLIGSGVLMGFYMVSLTTASAVSAELVPPDQMGRWQGTIGLFNALVGACGVFLAGAIWDLIGPEYLFLTFIGIDLLIRIPLLVGMPETLGLRMKTERK